MTICKKYILSTTLTMAPIEKKSNTNMTIYNFLFNKKFFVTFTIKFNTMKFFVKKNNTLASIRKKLIKSVLTHMHLSCRKKHSTHFSQRPDICRQVI